MAKGSDRLPARRGGTRPPRSSDVAIAKPLLPCHSTSHQSLQLAASTRLPTGILATISLPVPAAARRFTVDATVAGSAVADHADSSTRVVAQIVSRDGVIAMLS